MSDVGAKSNGDDMQPKQMLNLSGCNRIEIVGMCTDVWCVLHQWIRCRVMQRHTDRRLDVLELVYEVS